MKGRNENKNKIILKKESQSNIKLVASKGCTRDIYRLTNLESK